MEVGMDNSSRNSADDFSTEPFIKITDEIKFEQVFVEEELSCSESVSLNGESLLVDDMVTPHCNILATNEASGDSHGGSQQHAALAETEANTEMNFLAYLHFDLLPNCSVQLQKLNVVREECCDTRKKDLPETSPVDGEPTSQDASERNTRTHHKKVFRCRECIAVFPCKQDLRMHMRSHSWPELFSCPHCDEQFHWESSLRRHQKVHAVDLPHYSPSCKQNKTLGGSKLSVHLGRETIYSLPSPRTDGTVESRNISGSRERKNYSCLPSHRVNVTVTDNISSNFKGKKYSCIVCNERFDRKYNLKLHMYVHTKEKPHVCKICSAKFSIKESLNRHSRTHSGERPFSCMSCGMTFSQRAHLKTHLDTHTGMKYACSECKQVFSQKVYLMRHVRIHSGERPYSCPHCPATFVNTSSASRHRRLHTGRKPYSCADCGTRFILKESLMFHVERQQCKKE